MAKHYSKKFWAVFIVVSFVLLLTLFVFLEWKRSGFASLNRWFGIVPVKEELQQDMKTLLSIADAVSETNGQTKTYLVLFQNNMELRPGGGFIGSFGILKVRDGQVLSLDVHDTINFDGRIPDTVPAPYPMKETLGVRSLKLRDSNHSPDFATNAKAAEDFYHLGKGEEQLDGVIGITTRVLESVLAVTGPVEVPGYEGSYGKDNAVLDLEYQVEQNYYKQGISFGDRKSIMGELSAQILKKIKAAPLSQKYELFQVLLKDLHAKDIQVAFKDKELQSQVLSAGWDGNMDTTWNNDYLFLVDANANAFKSDLYVERSYDYKVDLTDDQPRATLAVTYNHTAKEKSYLTKDYQAFARVYVPKGTFIETIEPLSHQVVYGEESNKKYTGTIVQVPLGTQKTLTYSYKLPQTIETGEMYDLKIQKQPGMKNNPVKVEVKHKNGTVKKYQFNLERDVVLSTLTPQ
jgi:Protein of unknown function (DUF4012)